MQVAVARRTFSSQNVQSTPFSDHFFKLRCQKIARRCSQKDMFKSKCTKHTLFGPLFKVAMSKNCTGLWREAHLQVKMLKKLTVSDHFLKSGCRKIARRCGAKLIFKAKMYKTPAFCNTFGFGGSDVEKVSDRRDKID